MTNENKELLIQKIVMSCQKGNTFIAEMQRKIIYNFTDSQVRPNI
jgi:hypothetical protein